MVVTRLIEVKIAVPSSANRVDRIEAIVWHHLGPILLSDRVGGEAIHVHFDVGANLPIG